MNNEGKDLLHPFFKRHSPCLLTPRSCTLEKFTLFGEIHAFFKNTYFCKIHAFWRNSRFLEKFMHFSKIRNFAKFMHFGQIHAFWRNSRFLEKFTLFGEIHAFWRNSRFFKNTYFQNYVLSKTPPFFIRNPGF